MGQEQGRAWGSRPEESLCAPTPGCGCSVPRFSSSQARGLTKAQTRQPGVWSEVAGPHSCDTCPQRRVKQEPPGCPEKGTRVYVLNPDINLSEAEVRTPLMGNLFSHPMLSHIHPMLSLLQTGAQSRQVFLCPTHSLSSP